MKRALISVYDKEGIVEFAENLELLGWNIISTGGTFKLLKEAGIKAIEVYNVTGFPEILEGRVKTLNPLIHGGILYKRGDSEHEKTIRELGISSIDMVVNNLYPFEEMLKDRSSHKDMIENIDIGGPSMIRSAAKNYKDVIVITDPKDYQEIIGRLKMSGLNHNYRLNLAQKAFSYTAYYDSIIASYFNSLDDEKFPERLTLTYKKNMSLRYGENPHQSAAFYEELGSKKGTISSGRTLHGRALSFNNINDANGALKILKEFQQPTIVGVKHANPSGIGSAETIEEAFEKMYSCDRESIFGGIIASNREINLEIAEQISEIFIEIVLAPSFSKDALEILTKKKNIRLIEIDDIMNNKYDELDMKKTIGGLLLQTRDEILFKDYEIVTKRIPSEEELQDLVFSFKCVKHINSNGIVIAKNLATLGFGLGEVNRFWACEKAIERSAEGVRGSVLASDGFFPFKDSIEILGKAGVKAIIQPGGSIKDPEVIAAADKYDIAMIFTNMRHFKH
nr:bifunctional phosphoribosylaminoimidazolecarboxamide formyltransferase/IMP cyclohydrolase [Tissierella sp.]